jgi:hypothetical protein
VLGKYEDFNAKLPAQIVEEAGKAGKFFPLQLHGGAWNRY